MIKDNHHRFIFFENTLSILKGYIKVCDWNFSNCIITQMYMKLNWFIASALLMNDLVWRIYQSFDTAANDLHFKSKMINDQISFKTCHIILICIGNDFTHLMAIKSTSWWVEKFYRKWWKCNNYIMIASWYLDKSIDETSDKNV